VLSASLRDFTQPPRIRDVLGESFTFNLIRSLTTPPNPCCVGRVIHSLTIFIH
jgi:hypothetical protein